MIFFKMEKILEYLKQIKEVYAIDPNLAGELAISICELAVTGQMSSENPMVRAMLANFEDVAVKNIDKYDRQVNAKLEARANKQGWYTIAKLLREGKKQIEISKILGISSSTVNDRIKAIRQDYPELLENPEKNPDPKNPENSENGSPDFPDENPGNPEQKNRILIEKADLDWAKNPENPENPEYDNDNDNVNDNVLSSYEERLPLVSLRELNQMGVQFTWLDGETIQVMATGKTFRIRE